MDKSKNIKNTKFTILIFLFCMAMVLTKGPKLNLCSDYMWHYKIGEYMVQNKAFYWTDTFSWLSAEGLTTQFTYSWLGDIIIYLFSSKLATEANPMLGIWLYERILLFISLAVILLASKKHFEKMKLNTFTALFVVIFPSFMIIMLSPRPQMLSNILFAVMLFLFQEWDSGNVKAAYGLPAITLVWANIHGATIFLPILFSLAFLAASLITFKRGIVCTEKKDKKSIVTLLAATVLSVITSMINPYKWRPLVYFLTYNNSAVKDHVQEMQPANIFDSVVVFLAIIVVVCIFLSKKKFSFYQLIPVASMCLMSLMYVRGQYYFAIATSYFIVYLLVNPDKDFIKPAPDKMYKIATVMISVLLVIYAGIVTNKSLTDTVPYVMNDPNFVDHKAMEILKEKDYERIFNSYNTGGHLIYNGIPCFVDSRAELYSEEVMEDHVNLFYGKVSIEEMNKIIDKYNFDGFYVENTGSLYKFLKLSGRYKEIYCGARYSIFE